jgi:hypothetical protein
MNKTTRNLIFLIIGAIFIIGLFCTELNNTDYKNYEIKSNNVKSNNGFSILEYNGHTYIKYVERDANYLSNDAFKTLFQLIHDPDCKCKNNN